MQFDLSFGSARSHVLAQVVFQNLRHESLDCTAYGGNLVQHGLAVGVGLQAAFERRHLSADAADARYQLFLACHGVGHRSVLDLIYHRGVSYTRTQVDRPLDISAHTHTHQFNDSNPLAERNTLRAVFITAAMMVVEIVGGYVLNSMALLADGWHMSSHALALGLSVGAYVLARRLANDRRFAFGTWKIEVLGGYSSALLLGVVAALMMFQSIERLFAPVTIRYDEAIAIASLGLGVNLLCAWLLRDGQHDHHHDHGHQHAHGHHGHHDINLRAAYLHVIADAATSVLAIAALTGGKYFGWAWLDPVMGIVGACLVSRWAYGLLRQSGKVLLDAEMDSPVIGEIREVVAERFPDAAICDLHAWRVGRSSYACILALVSRSDVAPEAVRDALAVHGELVHVTVEVQKPDGCGALGFAALTANLRSPLPGPRNA